MFDAMRNSGWTDGIGLDALQYGLGEHAVDRSPERQKEKTRTRDESCMLVRSECEDEPDTTSQDEQ
jgi:hypothetical protein